MPQLQARKSIAMNVQIENQKLIKTYLSSFICYFFLYFTQVIAFPPPNVTCPFKYIYEFGDGVSDTGNSIRILPYGPFLPAARLPYGKTFPGRPTGRWSDGRIEYDYAIEYLCLPNSVPYVAINGPTSNIGVTFAVANSPILGPLFFKLRGIRFPPYAVPLSGRLTWFKNYLKTICSTPKDCADRLANSLLFVGDVEANDIGYALAQGKSIQEVTTYVPLVAQAIVAAIRELIGLGATLIVVPGTAPLGCYPYILTALQTNYSTAYDLLGCLTSVNNLILSKNAGLQAEISKLSLEFPNTKILYADIYAGVLTTIQQASLSGNVTLKSCCGIGGKYNYDSQRFCGSPGVPVCANPSKYIYWDGLHFTQDTYNRYIQVLVRPTLLALNCIIT